MLTYPKLKFILDKQYDGQMIFEMLKSQTKPGVEDQAKNMEIDLELAQVVYKAKDYDLVKKQIDTSPNH